MIMKMKKKGILSLFIHILVGFTGIVFAGLATLNLKVSYAAVKEVRDDKIEQTELLAQIDESLMQFNHFKAVDLLKKKIDSEDKIDKLKKIAESDEVLKAII